MGTDNEDTDPSSPRCAAPDRGRRNAGERPEHPTTDPGLGPVRGRSSRRTGRSPSSFRRLGAAARAAERHHASGDAHLRRAPRRTRTRSSCCSRAWPGRGPSDARRRRRVTERRRPRITPSTAFAGRGPRPSRVRRSWSSGAVAGGVVQGAPPPVGRSRWPSREALSTFVPARVLRRRAAMALVAGRSSSCSCSWRSS